MPLLSKGKCDLNYNTLCNTADSKWQLEAEEASNSIVLIDSLIATFDQDDVESILAKKLCCSGHIELFDK